MLLGLFSPPGASHDEWLHAPSIWCAQGVRLPSCADVYQPIGTHFVGKVNFDPNICFSSEGQSLICPSSRPNRVNLAVLNDNLYPPVFYYVLSWFVAPTAEVSFFLVRAGNALILTTVLAALTILLPGRHRIVLFLVVLTGFPSTGYFLFASLNPSSWASLGVGVGWLALHGALYGETQGGMKRLLLLLLSCLTSIMAGGSRWDAIPFVACSTLLVVGEQLLRRFSHVRKQLAALLTSLVVGFWVLLETYTPLSPFQFTKILFEYSEGGRDNTAFLTDNLIQGLPNALDALGSVPTHSRIPIPETIFVINIALLGYFMARTFNHRAKIQWFGFATITVTIAAVIAAQIAALDARDHGPIEPRYVYPLLLFGLGWWYLHGPNNLHNRLQFALPYATNVATLVFALTNFIILERFVDRQTFVLRYLPEGADNWWWSWLPVGPNTLVILAPFCLWMFFKRFLESTGFAPMPAHRSH